MYNIYIFFYLICYVLFLRLFLFSNPSKQLNFIIILHTTCALEEVNNLMWSTTSSFYFLYGDEIINDFRLYICMKLRIYIYYITFTF